MIEHDRLSTEEFAIEGFRYLRRRAVATFFSVFAFITIPCYLAVTLVIGPPLITQFLVVIIGAFLIALLIAGETLSRANRAPNRFLLFEDSFRADARSAEIVVRFSDIKRCIFSHMKSRFSEGWAVILTRDGKVIQLTPKFGPNHPAGMALTSALEHWCKVSGVGFDWSEGRSGRVRTLTIKM